MRKVLFVLILLSQMVLCATAQTAQQAAITVEQVEKFKQQAESLTNEELLKKFISQPNNSDKADYQHLMEFEYTINAISKEIFRRGEPILSLLKTIKGDIRFNWSARLGRRTDGIPTDPNDKPETNDGTHLTNEVAALYLISAVYYQKIDFASESYLDDGSCVYWSDYNKPQKVERAWKSFDKRFELYNEKGVKSLRENKINPLKYADMNWIGDGGKYTGAFKPCDENQESIFKKTHNKSMDVWAKQRLCYRVVC